MSLLDKYNPVEKHGYQFYKGKHLLVSKNLIDKIWEQIEKYFSTEKSDYNLVYYLGSNGVNTNYTDLYCSKNDFKKFIEPVLKHSNRYL